MTRHMASGKKQVDLQHDFLANSWMPTKAFAGLLKKCSLYEDSGDW